MPFLQPNQQRQSTEGTVCITVPNLLDRLIGTTGGTKTVSRGELQRLLSNLNALVAVSKGMRAVKLCTSKILQFLTGGAG